MSQVRCMSCALYFYYISSTSEHRASDPRDWGPLFWCMAVSLAPGFVVARQGWRYDAHVAETNRHSGAS